MPKKKIKISPLTLILPITIISLVLLLTTNFMFTGLQNLTVMGTLTELPEKTILDSSAFFDDELFSRSLSKKNNIEIPNSTNVKGAIIPHHTLPGYMISSLFKEINPSTVILIGPNHEEAGNTYFITTDSYWDTPFGTVYSDYEFIDKAIRHNENLEILDGVVSRDHAIAGVLPYIKYFSPNSKIVPILISNNTPMKELEDFAEYLATNTNTNTNDGTIVVGAFDFSHYLSKEQAQKRDLVTKKAILDKNYQLIYALDSEYTDSSKALILLLKFADNLGLNTNIIHNTNSGSLVDTNGQVTSYFLISFD